MHRAINVIAGMFGLAALAGCVPDNNQVSATPPAVSYRVAGTDISQASVGAAQYCQRYGATAQYQGLQQTGSGNVATFSCYSGYSGPVAVSGSSAPPYSPAYAPPPAPVVQCADKLHQNWPGGTDYYGPPVPGCPRLQ